MIIINADDFGMSDEVNHAIVACFHKGVITSATIMANMPAFEHACHLATQNDLCKRIGIHLNISEGIPITKNILIEPNFCNPNGEFCFQRNTGFFFTQNEKAALTEEIDAQIKRCLDMSLSLTHLDSHHHVHTEWPVFEVIRPLVRKYGIRFVRPARNDNPRNSLLARTYKAIFNTRLSQMGLRRTRFFGDIEGFGALKMKEKRGFTSFEIMVHPTWTNNGTIIDSHDGTDVIVRIRQLTEGLNLSSFAS